MPSRERFVEEAEENIERILRGLDSVFAEVDDPNPETINELFRAFHTIKGLSYSMDFRNLGDLAHKLEDLFSAVEKEEIKLTRKMVARIMDVVEKMKDVIQQIEGGADDSAIEEEDINLIESMLKGEFKDDEGERKEEEKKKEEKVGLPKEVEALDLSEDEKRKIKLAIQKNRSIFLVEAEVDFSELDTKTRQIQESLSSGGYEILSTSLSPSPESADKMLTQIIVAERKPKIPVQNIVSQFSAKLKVIWKRKEAPAVKQDRKGGDLAIRVSMKQINQIMDILSDIVLAKNFLYSQVSTLEGEIAQKVLLPLAEMEKRIKELQDMLFEIRMVRISELFDELERDILKTAASEGKEVEVEKIGTWVTIDREIFTKLREALMHIAKNAVVHGIEYPEERERFGKRPKGKITLRASRKGEYISIEIEDDGRGIDPAVILEKYAEKKEKYKDDPKLSRYYQADPSEFYRSDGTLDEKRVLELIFIPGFSTKEETGKHAGRGVGLDAVKSFIESLRGKIELRSTPHKGTTFIITIPTAKVVTQVILFKWKGEVYAVPLYSVRRNAHSDEVTVKSIQGRKVADMEGVTVPLITPDEVFGYSKDGQLPEKFFILEVMVGGEGGTSTIGLVVEDIIGIKDVVVRNLTEKFFNIKGVSGVAEVGDRKFIPIIDALKIST